MKRKSLNAICVVIGVVGFFLMLGSVGTMDLNMETGWTIPSAFLGVIMMVVAVIGNNKFTDN